MGVNAKNPAMQGIGLGTQQAKADMCVKTYILTSYIGMSKNPTIASGNGVLGGSKLLIFFGTAKTTTCRA